MKMRVMSVPTNRPPMIVTARLPNMASGISGIIPRMVVSDVMRIGRRRILAAKKADCLNDRTKTALAALNECGTWTHTVFYVEGDLIHQHNSVLNHHTDKSEHTYNCHESERFACEQDCRYYSDKDKRNTAEDNCRFLEILEQHQQDDNHDNDGDRESFEQVFDALVAGLFLALPRQAVTCWQLDVLNLLCNGSASHFCSHSWLWRTLHSL